MALASVNFTLFASSPMFNFAPQLGAGVGSASTGWQFNQSGETGLYYTTRAGSSMQLQFYGTGIQLQGSAGCPFSVNIDGDAVEESLASGLIFSKTGLEQETHNLNLTVGPGASTDAEVIFTSAIIIDEFPVGQVPLALNYPASNNTLDFFGPWDSFANGTAQTDFPAASVTVNFTGPAIIVNGPAGTAAGVGQFSVIVDGNPGLMVTTPALAAPSTQLFFQSGLDPNQQHSVTIINLPNSTFAFDNIQIWGSTSTFPSSAPFATGTAVGTIPVEASTSSHSNVVKIVAPIVAVVAALLILAAALLFRRRQRRRTTLRGPFAMRLSRAFGKQGAAALTLHDLGPKAEQPVSFGIDNMQKA
ncbi:hypothetical protein CERSUDRAFT_116771 [Gelatoporia subvermispora B]|uniref:Uncharacterized protein n=1 Tax=Ceriporiopsis subvermispora (strain B) TaxID=914234 RepID=M2R848_CERS8|nr:hypothetical protein CERSUDRAFT_116771 [Gelatoporia subvermispora B]